MASLPYLELTGSISNIATAEQVNRNLWKRVVILDVLDEEQPGEGEIKIEFLQQHMELLDKVSVGNVVTVRFTVRGVAYVREGITGHLVILRGHYLRAGSDSRLPYNPFRKQPAPDGEEKHPSPYRVTCLPCRSMRFATLTASARMCGAWAAGAMGRWK